jgi:hypothetical protein
MSRNLERDELVKILESNKVIEEEVKAPTELFLLPGFQEAESQVYFVPSCKNILQNYLSSFCTKYPTENLEPKS